MMSTIAVSIVILSFLALLMLISYLSAKNSDEKSFFTGNRQSPWYLVAFGMIGSTISGVTFISVPGIVGVSHWTYLQFLLGNLVGYWFIASVLLPLYYRLKLVSIYEYLNQRFGFYSYKTGAAFFLLSQTVGASFRLFLAAGVLQFAFFQHIGVPFWLTSLLTLFTIWLYTRRAGIKTVVWTDTLQTAFIIAAVAVSIWAISSQLNLNILSLKNTVLDSEMSNIFDWDWKSKTNFVKQFLAGLATVIAINGLDQNMMQKNLTCKNRKEAQKNMYWFSFSFIFVNLLFLSLGVLLYFYAQQKGIAIPEQTDSLYPFLALNHFGTLASILFLLGILAAAYSSADSAITALTTSFCVDFLNVDTASPNTKRTRTLVHLSFSGLVFLVILTFGIINNNSVVEGVFKAVGYTYGPLLGLFAFGLTTNMKPLDVAVPYICIASPLLCWLISANSKAWLFGYTFGFELLILNALLCYVGLALASLPKFKDNERKH